MSDDAGAGGSAGSSGSSGGKGATTGGSGGGSTGGGSGTPVGGTGGTTVGGTGGTTGGIGGSTTVGGTGGVTTVGGTGGIATGGASGSSGGVGGTGGSYDPGPEFSSCAGPGLCTLVPIKCCLCGLLTMDLTAAINTSKVETYQRQTCGVPPPPCPPCVGTIDPHLMARCEAGRCRGFDVRSDPNYTGCTADGQCTLRKGLGCCDCQPDDGTWVALNASGLKNVPLQSCAPGTACPGCVPIPPPDTKAVCRAGICERSP